MQYIFYNWDTGEEIFYIPVDTDCIEITKLQTELDSSVSVINNGETICDTKHHKYTRTGDILRYDVWNTEKYKPLHEIYKTQKDAENKEREDEDKLKGGPNCKHRNYTPIGEYQYNDGWVDAVCNDCGTLFRHYDRIY